MNSWELMFIQSKVNSGAYAGDVLAPQNWAWPKETWFQKRLGQLRNKRRHTARQSNELQTAQGLGGGTYLSC
jgi:hypothetical protein